MAGSEHNETNSFYHLMDLKGGGFLVEMARELIKTNNHAELDKVIKCKIEPFLYNKGKGKTLPVSDIIHHRIRSRQLSKSESKCNQKEVGGRELEEMKFVCWNVDKRGLVGETGLHVCLLLNSQEHLYLATR